MSETNDTSTAPLPPTPSRKIVIEYCTLCRWQLRANWLQQELLSTFADEIDQAALHPSTGGVFRVWFNEVLVWDRVRDQGFPDAKQLKQKVRDLICPERDLGHIDRTGAPPTDE